MEISKRLLSLDVFRGITIAGMIMVNNPGSWSYVYKPLGHAEWHGCTPTDLVFPFFLFIVGVSISLALTHRKERGDDHRAIIKKILWRTAMIFLIGMFLAGFPFFNLGTIRIPGVLQRIAIVYGIAAIIFLKTTWKTQVYISVGLLLGYWALMTLVPVPDGHPPNLDAKTNLGAWLDRLLLDGHLWSQSKVWDPEGLLSTMPAVVSGIAGILTGTWLRTNHEPYKKITGMLGVGAVLIVIALFWDMAFPINKKIWTSSYVLYTSGIALQFLAIIYWLVDVLKYQKHIKPFVAYGMNALIIYALSGLVAKTLYTIKWSTVGEKTTTLQQWLYDTFFLSWTSGYHASFLWAITNVLFFLGIAWVLYKKKIFIKV